MQGIRNDDQSLSPVIPLVSLLLLSFLILFRNMFYLLVDIVTRVSAVPSVHRPLSVTESRGYVQSYKSVHSYKECH